MMITLTLKEQEVKEAIGAWLLTRGFKPTDRYTISISTTP